MAVPTGLLTMDDLIRKVAEKLAVANYRSDGTPYLPVGDAFNLSKCTEMVNRGIRMFIDRPPREGWRWMRRSCSVTFDVEGDGSNNIDTDPARYMLPVEFGGQALGKITYAKGTNHSTQIEWRHESFIRQRRADVVNTGYPQYAAIRPYQPTTPAAASGRRWELIVDPQPSAADTVEFPYLVTFDGVRLIGGTATSGTGSAALVDSSLVTLYPKNDMLKTWVAEIVNGTGRGSYATITSHVGSTGQLVVTDWLAPDGSAAGTDPTTGSEYILKPVHPYYHPAGWDYDGVIEVACLAACELYGGDAVSDDHYTRWFYESKIKEAWEIDKRMAPKRLGRMTDGPRQSRERLWDTVTTDHDV